MSQRILKNNTASPVTINDVGQTVPASGQLVINPTDYGKYEGSSDVIGFIGSSTLTVNDGTFDLSITDGTRLIQGGFYLPLSDGRDSTIKASVIQETSVYNKNFVAVSGVVAVSGSALPAGASTSANQLTEIAILTTISGHETSIDSKLFNNYGAASGALRTASQIGNTNGQADFDAGAVGPQTLRTGANQLGVWNINNVSGVISLPTGASTAANQATEIAILTTISGHETSIDSKLVDGYGAAAGALRTASQIGNTNGQADFDAGPVGPQTLRTGANQLGVWNINNISGVISLPTGAATAANQATEIAILTSISGFDNSMNNKMPTQGQKNIAGSWPFVWPSDASTVGSVSGVNSSVSLGVSGQQSAVIQVSGTWVGTVQFQISYDSGVTFQPVTGQPIGGGGSALATSTTVNGSWIFKVGAASIIKALVSAYTSGTISVLISESFALHETFIRMLDSSGNQWTLGQKNTANSIPVTFPSDQASVPLAVSGVVPDSSPYIYGQSIESVVGGVYNDVGATMVSGTQGALRMTQQRGLHSNLRNAQGTEISSAATSVSGQQLLHVQTPDNFGSTVALGALNAAVSLPITGMASVGLQLDAGTLIGTIQAQCSLDGGVTWKNCPLFDSASQTTFPSVIFTAANTLQVLSFLPISGASHAQVIVTAYTSGTANCRLRASNVVGSVGNSLLLQDPQTLEYANVDPRSELRVATAVLLLGNEQTGTTLDTNMWTTSLVGSGTDSVSGGYNILSTGATANSSAILQSLNRGRFITGTINAFYGAVRLDAGVTNNTRRWGAMASGDDGVFFILTGTTVGVGFRRGGVDTITTTLNGRHAIVLDTLFHTYEIQYTSGDIYYYQDGNLVHTYLSTTLPVGNQPHYKLGFENVNSGGLASNVNMYVRGCSIMRYGQAVSRPRYFHPFYTSRVQAVSNSTSGTATSLAATIAASTAGNLLFVVITTNGASTPTVADNLSQTYSTAFSFNDGSGGGGRQITGFYVANTLGGVTTVTLTNGTAKLMNIVVSEYANVAASAPLDKTQTSNNAASTSFTSGATATTTQANELLLGFDWDTAKNTVTYTPGTNWNSVTSVQNAGGAGGGTLYQEEQYVSTVGAYTATGTISASDANIGAIATFKMQAAVLSSGFTIPTVATVIKIGAGTFRKIVINALGTGGATATFYDGTSVTTSVIAVVSLTAQTNIFEYDLDFNNGLTMVVTNASADFTVIYD